MNTSFYVVIAFSLTILSCSTGQKKELKISPLFSNHMVLQQQEEVNFWGEYTPGGTVVVSGSWGKEVTTKVDTNGVWKLKLATPKAGGSHTVAIKTNDSTISISDVLIGEVWLASGQSNMEMPLKGWPPNDIIKNSNQEIANAANDNIRMLTVERNLSINPLESITASWLPASSETAGDFSATAFFFAKRLYKELNVPIGIIHSSWGGTPAEAWTSRNSLNALGEFKEEIANLEKLDSKNLVEAWFKDRKTIKYPTTITEWENINLSDLEASTNTFKDTHWETIELPARFDVLSSGEFDGVLWLRKEFTIKDISTDYKIHIGAVDDMDITYINGKKIGGLVGSGVYNLPRDYTIPKSILVEGKNTIAIRVIDTGGPGEVKGPITLYNSKNESISLAGTWKHLLVAERYTGLYYTYDLDTNISERPNIFALHANLPTVLYNAMINPLVPYNVKGAIWYQGESNVDRAEQYKKVFPAMIENWRSSWAKDFPFYFVQIAPFNYNERPSQEIRNVQRIALQTPNTGMVVTLDIGNPINIHPANKQDVGSRLAGLALENDYAKNIVSSGPLYKEVRKEGRNLIVSFTDIGSGLTHKGNELLEFEIAGADKVFVSAKAKIEENTVVVSSKKVIAPEYVRYAWKNTSEASLFNLDGLPASTFSSEE
ncbi:MAG: sialate O-acetylesterase [Cellulophaga sp.]